MDYEREKDNKLLASCLRGTGIAAEDVATILRLTNARQTWLELADCARTFEALNYEQRKELIQTHFSTEKYGEAVREAHHFLARYRTETAVGKEVLPLYAAVSAVAHAKFNGTHRHISAVAAALCELLEYDAEQPDPQLLTVRILGTKEFKEGLYKYDLETFALTYDGDDL